MRVYIELNKLGESKVKDLPYPIENVTEIEFFPSCVNFETDECTYNILSKWMHKFKTYNDDNQNVGIKIETCYMSKIIYSGYIKDNKLDVLHEGFYPMSKNINIEMELIPENKNFFDGLVSPIDFIRKITCDTCDEVEKLSKELKDECVMFECKQCNKHTFISNDQRLLNFKYEI